jgi:hypothetical protein
VRLRVTKGNLAEDIAAEDIAAEDMGAEDMGAARFLAKLLAKTPCQVL